MKREHKPTSKLGESFIKPHKLTHREKIVAALIALRVGGNHEQIAEAAGLRPDQIWKRLSEAQRDGEIFDTGCTRPLKSSVPGIVWQLCDLSKIDNFPKRLPPITHNLQLQLL